MPCIAGGLSKGSARPLACATDPVSERLRANRVRETHMRSPTKVEKSCTLTDATVAAQ
jgi:anti-sigma factor RsiW